MLGARLKLVGSCRGPGDEIRIEVLRAEAASLGIADSVDWCAAPSQLSHDTMCRLPCLEPRLYPPARFTVSVLAEPGGSSLQRTPSHRPSSPLGRHPDRLLEIRPWA